jgi:hypothetical protein
MLRILFTVVFAFIVSWGVALATNQVDYEIITMFADGVVEMPKGLMAAAISDVTFKPASIKQTLLNYNAQTISRGFPNYNPADSLIESPRFPGLTVKQPALNRI